MPDVPIGVDRHGLTQVNPLPPKILDTRLQGFDRVTAVFLLQGERNVLIESGPAVTLPNVMVALDEAGVERIDEVLLTHVHLDHAGATGGLARNFPEARFRIHERVARYLIDPTRLTEGARQVWGSGTDRMFGIAEPVPEDRVIPLSDGDVIDLGDRKVTAIATPGHTRAHHAFLDHGSGVAFCGDAIGIRLPGSDDIRASAPPADFNLEATLESLEMIRGIGATELWPTHFGPAATGSDVGPYLDRAAAVFIGWREIIERERTLAEDEQDLVRRVEAAVAAELESAPEEVRRRIESANPAWLNVAGMTQDIDRAGRR